MKYPKLTDYPNVLHIKKQVWEIKFVSRINDECLGLCDPLGLTIYIKKGQRPRERLSAFIHEVIHALECEYGFDMTSKVIENKKEHDLVNSFEAALLEFLEQNGRAISILTPALRLKPS